MEGDAGAGPLNPGDPRSTSSSARAGFRSESGIPLSSPRPACSRHFRYPRRPANAPMMAVTHHTTIAECANGDDRCPIEAPSAVYTNARGAEPMNEPTAICHNGTPSAPNA